ncbi:unnamed protein product [Clonostachys rosea f. rosea IK726]|uniref:tRNA wybutosine-synthesizing protein 2 n=2 Tax=Bionectria ochroleuca TaxID=29856 RepID=A0A0B7JRJ1_BIOOC|nr:unnamed protein product [Clonostachys rosea f. rosea IK726]
MGKQRQQNPILSALSQWLEDLGLNTPGAETDDGGWRQEIIDKTPKRFTVYEPMALLPAGSFTHPSWKALLARKAGSELTHLAVTEGIPLLKEGDEQGEENVLRSPSGLRMLHGDFGPSAPVGPGGGPAEEDFERALWVSTKQNGIYQTWAPRWTMFSRGNVKEKARLLEFKLPPTGQAGHDVWAADLYGGIGYFVFSYASLGMRVLCWEINPWSVEGLRRGALSNRWTVRVVQGDELQLPAEDLIRGGEQIVVFLEDNQKALGRIRSLQASGSAGEIRHVNCGFLPTSEATWKPAWDMTCQSSETWFHFHENVGADGIKDRQSSIESLCKSWAASEGSARSADADHVELVKTFAPGVWHCVFDVHVTRSSSCTT